MYIQTKNVTGHNISQVAYPVGKNQDSYSIVSFFTEDLETGEVTSQHSLVKNWFSPEFNPKYKYKEGARFRETIFVGSYKECANKVKEIVEQEGEL